MAAFLGRNLGKLDTAKVFQQKKTLEITLQKNDGTTQESDIFVINDEINFQVRLLSFYQNNRTYSLFLVKAVKCNESDSNRNIIVKSDALQIECILEGAYGMWRVLLWLNDEAPSYIDFSVNIHNPGPQANRILGALHADEELTDFELCGEDGGVHIHRAVLAAASPVLRAMLEGQWRESEQGSVKVKGITCTTLSHLKDYIYLNTLPAIGVDQLLLLAKYYQINDLEQHCKVKLVESLTTENLFSLVEFAIKNELRDLLIMIFKSVQKGNIELNIVNEVIVNKTE